MTAHKTPEPLQAEKYAKQALEGLRAAQGVLFVLRVAGDAEGSDAALKEAENKLLDGIMEARMALTEIHQLMAERGWGPLKLDPPEFGTFGGGAR